MKGQLSPFRMRLGNWRLLIDLDTANPAGEAAGA
jgi:hypothetical protein